MEVARFEEEEGMLRFMLKPAAVALGLIVAAGPAPAGDTRRLDLKPGDGGAADDTELVYHPHRSGYYPGGGYYKHGHYGGYYGGYHGYYGGYYGGYRPGFGVGFYFGTPNYYAPRYYAPSFYYPRPFYGYGYSSYSFYNGYGYCPIGGVGAAPGLAIDLALRAAEPPPARRATPNDPLYRERAQALPSPFAGPRAAEVPPPAGTFRYDGGPANPVPQPAPDPASARPGELPLKPLDLRPRPGADVLNISYPPKPAVPAKPAYRYPAYGEK